MSIANSTQINHKTDHSQLRPLDIKRDLLEVANLIELCFSDTLDKDGRKYISQLRDAAKSSSTQGFPGYLGQSIAGYIWEEQGVIVGNISLIPVFAQNKQAYLIANVAVHPRYRLKGIAKALTAEALSHIKSRRIQSVWLQANIENPAAIHLYRSLGFVERARRTTWHSDINRDLVLDEPQDIRISRSRRKDWPYQRKWLQECYPSSVTWHLALNISRLSPGFFAGLNRFFNEKKIIQWVAHEGEQLIGTLIWQSSKDMADFLWLASSPENEALVIKTLIPHALRSLKKNRLLTINYNADRGEEAFQELGFKSHRTLVWMSLVIL